MEWRDTFSILFERGGPLMWPLGFCSLLVVAISVERFVFWWREDLLRRRHPADPVLAQAAEGDFAAALATSKSGRTATTRILSAGLAARSEGMDEAVMVAAGRELACMRQGLGVLDTVVTMAPLLGILGTVLGIIESFEMLGGATVQDPRAVTMGIAQALITTATGLTVALLALAPMNYFIARVRNAAMELEHVGLHLVAACRKGAVVCPRQD